MLVAQIQPQFAPNLYDLTAMLRADRVALLDTDIWSRKGRTHRAKIRVGNSADWINIPILTEDKKKEIREVRIDHSQDWFTPFWNAILHNYSDATYFDFYADELYAEFTHARQFEKLIDFNLYIFQKLLTYLEISINYLLNSQKQFSIDNNDSIIQEFESRNYIRQLENAATLPINHPEYQQVGKGFVQECSILDLLLNLGPESFRLPELSILHFNSYHPA